MPKYIFITQNIFLFEFSDYVALCYRVVQERALYLCGPREMEGRMLTAVTQMVTPIASIPCPSVAPQSTGPNPGTSSSVPQL